MATCGLAADRLIIKNDAGDQKLKITDNGWIGINTADPLAEIDLGGGTIAMNGNDTTGGTRGELPRLSWMENGRLDFGYGGYGGAQFELYSQGHADRSGEFRFIYGGGDFGSVRFMHYNGSRWLNAMTLDKDGNLHMSDGAWCDGNTWYSTSSRKLKYDIEPMSTEEAVDILKQLNPVSFYYKTNKQDKRTGFIAEDLPEPVAVPGKTSVCTLDLVAVLTKVVQAQQDQIERLEKRISALEEGSE
jgi:hypothetical protein